METTTRPGTPLRHRMLDDMRMRKTPRALKIFDDSNCTLWTPAPVR